MAPRGTGWATVAAGSAAAVLLSRSMSIAEQIRQGEWTAAWDGELRRLRELAGRLLPAPRPAALPG